MKFNTVLMLLLGGASALKLEATSSGGEGCPPTGSCSPYPYYPSPPVCCGAPAPVCAPVCAPACAPVCAPACAPPTLAKNSYCPGSWTPGVQTTCVTSTTPPPILAYPKCSGCPGVPGCAAGCPGCSGCSGCQGCQGCQGCGVPVPVVKACC